jgi:hypothetical protein
VVNISLSVVAHKTIQIGFRDGAVTDMDKKKRTILEEETKILRCELLKIHLIINVSLLKEEVLPIQLPNPLP